MDGFAFVNMIVSIQMGSELVNIMSGCRGDERNQTVPGTSQGANIGISVFIAHKYRSRHNSVKKVYYQRHDQKK